MTAARLGAAGRIASYQQRFASFAEVAGIISLFCDLPTSSETNAVWMQQPPETFSVDAPAQIRMRINCAGDGLLKKISFAKGQNALQHAPKRNLVGWHRIGVRTTPHLLIRFREDGIAHFGETRSFVGAILVGEGFGPEV